jgi:Uma2 family endonuclease
MIPEPIQKLVSIDEFFELANSPHFSDMVVELIDGVIVEMTKPGFQHGVITNHLAFLLTAHATQNKLGIIIAAETGYVLAENTVRGVDIGFVSYQRLPVQPVQKHFPGAPDLAVEVISPTNEALDIHRTDSNYWLEKG